MQTGYAFIDGGYLSRVQDNAMQQLFGVPGEIDFQRLSATLTQHARNSLTRIFYYACIDDIRKPSESEAQFEARVQQQNQFLKKIQSLPGFFVRLGTLTGRRPGKLRQKEVDVLLAVDMLEHSFRKNMEVALLIAGDRDFVPIIESLVRLGTYVHVVYHPGSVSPELYEAADVAMNLNIDHLWGWSPAEFGAQHPIPLQNWQDGRADLSPRRVIRVGALATGQDVRIWEAHANLFTATVHHRPNTLLLNHRDQGILERYVALRFGQINWQ